jgi:hypothetical protein
MKGGGRSVRNDEPAAPLKEIQEIRLQILKEFGGDREKYYEYLVALQNSPELRGRLVTKEQLDRARQHPAA